MSVGNKVLKATERKAVLIYQCNSFIESKAPVQTCTALQCGLEADDICQSKL